MRESLVFLQITDIIEGHIWKICPTLKLLKNCDIVEIILVQGFCPIKIEITQFPDSFCLNDSTLPIYCLYIALLR